MKCARLVLLTALLPALQCGAQSAPAERSAAPLDESGHVTVDGRSVPYLVHLLPVSSFPALPVAIQSDLDRRGCLIPQTYEAHKPENVVSGSFEKAGSSDWAVLCSVRGSVTLLVFFARAPESPFTLASSPETQRLQQHDASGVLGFDWGIDAAAPDKIREAQRGMKPRPPKLDHDAVADETVERKTIYRYFARGDWTEVGTGD